MQANIEDLRGSSGVAAVRQRPCTLCCSCQEGHKQGDGLPSMKASCLSQDLHAMPSNPGKRTPYRLAIAAVQSRRAAFGQRRTPSPAGLPRTPSVKVIKESCSLISEFQAGRLTVTLRDTL